MTERKRAGLRLSADQETWLADGEILSGISLEECFDGDLKQAEQAWLLHGARIVEDFVTQRRLRRPYGWWLWDAPAGWEKHDVVWPLPPGIDPKDVIPERNRVSPHDEFKVLEALDVYTTAEILDLDRQRHVNARPPSAPNILKFPAHDATGNHN
jgi:hypothetical protein